MKNSFRNAFLLFFILSIVGCQSAYYSAMEKVGKHKRDILIDRVESAAESQKEAKEEYKYLGRKRPSFKTSPADLNLFLYDLIRLTDLERIF